MEPVQADIEEIEQSRRPGVSVAHRQQARTRAEARKWFKSAELATRDLARRIASFQDQMSYTDRALLDKVKARCSKCTTSCC